MRSFALSILFVILSLISSIADERETKQVAITFDDLPASNIATFEEQLRINQRILKILDQYRIEATGFVIANRLFGETKILDLWLKEGHDLGNHTYSHMDFDRVDVLAFQMNIAKGASKIKQLLKRYKKDLRYFRFPYLHEGNTTERKEAIRKFLEGNGYTKVPVTIDPFDSEYNTPFVKAWGSNDERQKDSIKTAYLEQVRKKTKEAEELSQQLFGRNIKHVLLLHLNRINAEVLDQILQYYVDSGYSFVPLKEALTDSVYSLREEYVGSEGLTWLERIRYGFHKR